MCHAAKPENSELRSVSVLTFITSRPHGELISSFSFPGLFETSVRKGQTDAHKRNEELFRLHNYTSKSLSGLCVMRIKSHSNIFLALKLLKEAACCCFVQQRYLSSWWFPPLFTALIEIFRSVLLCQVNSANANRGILVLGFLIRAEERQERMLQQIKEIYSGLRQDQDENLDKYIWQIHIVCVAVQSCTHRHTHTHIRTVNIVCMCA